MKIFRTVAVKSMKKNRTRTLVTIIGVILSVAMFTAVTTFISTLYGHMARVDAYENGSYCVAFSSVQAEALTETSLFGRCRKYHYNIANSATLFLPKI